MNIWISSFPRKKGEEIRRGEERKEEERKGEGRTWWGGGTQKIEQEQRIPVLERQMHQSLDIKDATAAPAKSDNKNANTLCQQDDSN